MPIIQTSRNTVTRPTNRTINWESFVNVAKSATITYVNDWIINTYIRVGTANGPVANIPCGGLESRTPINFPELLNTALVGIPGVPPQTAGEFAKQVWRTWKQWYQECQIMIPMAFPAFAAWPGPYAPLTPALNFPFLLGFAPTVNKCLNPVLKQKLITIAQDLTQTANTQSQNVNPQVFNRNNVAAGNGKNGTANTFYQGNDSYNASYKANLSSVPGLTPQQAMEDYANWFDERLDSWKLSALIINLFGEGPVPTYTPLAVPPILIGPVIKGTLKGERVLTGSRFG